MNCAAKSIFWKLSEPGVFVRAMHSAVSEAGPGHNRQTSLRRTVKESLMSQTSTPDSLGNQAKSASCLAHHFLVAMPQLEDSNFNGTVTYLWKHDEDGALGMVINRPASMSVAELLEDLEIEITARQSLDHDHVLSGGPVETHKGDRKSVV